MPPLIESGVGSFSFSDFLWCGRGRSLTKFDELFIQNPLTIWGLGGVDGWLAAAVCGLEIKA